MNEKDKILKLKEIIRNEKNIVFFGGAGVSTESGIPDFRSSSGLYSEKFHGISPEEILSADFFEKHPKEFYDYYFNNMIYPGVKPNSAHTVLAELEKQGKLNAVITQNIDGLHQKAGSKKVLELHGSSLRNYCPVCRENYNFDYILNAKKKNLPYPVCEKCGAVIRPDIVLYGEALDNEVYSTAEREISNADVLIVGGTSLKVYPAAWLIHSFKGKNLVIINKSETPYDYSSHLIINAPIGEVLKSAVEF